MTQATSFWQRRRAAVRAEAEQEEAQAVAELAAQDVAEQAELTDEELLEALDLPDPDTLKMGDDFTAFMAKAVPQHLRNRALRKLWRSNPVLACVDGLNDYDDDYLTGSFGNGPIQTGYQVGKGMLSHLLEVQRKADAALAALETETETEVEAEEAPAALQAPAEDVVAKAEMPRTEAAPQPEAAQDVEPVAEVTPIPRRMRFIFEAEQA